MKILVAGDYTQHWRAPAWARALRELGVEVIEYDWRKNFSPGLWGKLERRYVIGPGIWRINRRLVEMVYSQSPNILLIYAGQPILPATVQELARLCWVTGYQNDDPFGQWSGRFGGRFYRPYVESLRFYSSYHVFRDVNILEYQQHGCARVKLLRYFYLPWEHYPIELDPNDRERFGADVIFIGIALPGDRMGYITALLEARVKLRVYGDPRSWQRHLPATLLKRMPPINRVLGQDYAKAIRAAKICLAVFSAINRDQYSLRSFEIPACGGFMLAKRTPVMQSLFLEGEEADYFSDTSQLLAKVDHYLEHDDARVRIANAGRQRCLRDGYDVHNRMRQWLSDMAEWGSSNA